jgi:hypothetical protein
LEAFLTETPKKVFGVVDTLFGVGIIRDPNGLQARREREVQSSGHALPGVVSLTSKQLGTPRGCGRIDVVHDDFDTGNLLLPQQQHRTSFVMLYLVNSRVPDPQATSVVLQVSDVQYGR